MINYTAQNPAAAQVKLSGRNAGGSRRVGATVFKTLGYTPSLELLEVEEDVHGARIGIGAQPVADLLVVDRKIAKDSSAFLVERA